MVGLVGVAASGGWVAILPRGDGRSKGEEVKPGIFAILDAKPATIAARASGTTGRRAALADWLTRPAAECVREVGRQVRWAVRQSNEVERLLAGGFVVVLIAMLVVWRSARG